MEANALAGVQCNSLSSSSSYHDKAGLAAHLAFCTEKSEGMLPGPLPPSDWGLVYVAVSSTFGSLSEIPMYMPLFWTHMAVRASGEAGQRQHSPVSLPCFHLTAPTPISKASWLLRKVSNLSFVVIFWRQDSPHEAWIGLKLRDPPASD